MTKFEQLQIEQLKRIADVLEDINSWRNVLEYIRRGTEGQQRASCGSPGA